MMDITNQQQHQQTDETVGSGYGDVIISSEEEWQQADEEDGGLIEEANFYERSTKLGQDKLEELQVALSTTQVVDDGDTFYDTLALWASICMDNHKQNKDLANAIMVGIKDSCDILLEKVARGTQKDSALLQVTAEIEQMKALTDEYEQVHM
jgi:hypothetical protein